MPQDAWGTFTADKQTGSITSVQIVVGGVFDSPYWEAKDGIFKVEYVSAEDIRCSRQCSGASGAAIFVSILLKQFSAFARVRLQDPAKSSSAS